MWKHRELNTVVRKEARSLVETSDGGFYTGSYRRSPGSVTLLNANGATTTIPMGDVEDPRGGICQCPRDTWRAQPGRGAGFVCVLAGGTVAAHGWATSGRSNPE